MRIVPKPESTKGPAENFTGEVWRDSIAMPIDEGQSMVVALVRFAPCARTAWHSHKLGQTLHVVSGVALMQARGGEILEVHPGQTVYTPPGEEHWHGATATDFMEHYAMYDNAADPAATTTWLEHVTDEEYAGAT